MPAQPKLFEQAGPVCGHCPWQKDCGAMYGDKACRAKWSAKREGGGQVLHPAQPMTKKFMASVGGPGFDEIAAQALKLPQLPPYLPQLRIRKKLRGQLTGPAYSVTAGAVIGQRAQPLGAAKLREQVGLRADQLLVLLLFGKDKYLERLWDHREDFIPALAEGGFDLITGPSYSAWEPRPRPEYLYAAKRSQLVFAMLQDLGAPVIPRVVLGIPHDAKRFAGWANKNPVVTQVAVDLTTYRGRASFMEQLELIALFDQLTDGRLQYLINGPSTLERDLRLFEAIEPKRVSITNARSIARDAAPGTLFSEKVETERSVVAAAQRQWPLAAVPQTSGRLRPATDLPEARLPASSPAPTNRPASCRSSRAATGRRILCTHQSLR